MRINYWFFGVLFFLLASIENCQPPEKKFPEAKGGILDLTKADWSILKDGILPLDGEWEFYWNTRIPPTFPPDTNSTLKNSFIQVPLQWQKKTGSANGFATYRLRILLPPSASLGKQAYLHKTAIYLPNIGTAYELFLNGEKVIEQGKVSLTPEDSNYFMKPEILPLEEILFKEGRMEPKEAISELDLVFYVSNFEHPRAGIWDTLFFGKQKDLEAVRQRNLSIDLILASSLFIMGFYHLGIFLNRRKESSAIYFAIFCFFIGIRGLVIGDRFLLDAFPSLPFFILAKLEFLSFYFASYIFNQFFHSLFPEESSRKVHSFFGWLLIPCSLAVVFCPLSLYGKILLIVQANSIFMIFYIFFVTAKAIRKQRSGALLFGLGWIILSLAIIHDILKAVGMIFTPNIVGNGLLSFIVFQAIILSRKFASAFTQSEILSEKLKIISEDLEQKVLERTQSLLEAEKKAIESKEVAIHQREETEALNSLLKSLNEKIELKIIMQKVKGYIKNKYQIQHYGLSIVDASREYLVTIDGDFPDFLNEEERLYVSNAKTKIHGVIGGHAFAFKAKKPFFIPRIRKGAITEEESRIHDYLKFESLLIIPLILENEPMGFLDLFNVGRWGLEKEDITKLSILGEQLAGIIYASKLFEENRQKTKELKETLNIVQEDLSVAKRIQESLLIPNISDFEPLQIHKLYLPMTEIGGDFYDITKMNEHTFRIFIADATGHGVQAAMITMAIKGIFDSIKAYELDLASIMDIFNNEYVHRYSGLNSLLTAQIIEINCQEGKVSYVSAGHPSALVIRKDSHELLSKTGRIVGVRKYNQYESMTVDFPKGSRLYLYTDGIYEQFNEKLEEFGEDRLHDSLIASRADSITTSVQKVMIDLDQFLKNGKYQDDITVIVLEFSKQ